MKKGSNKKVDWQPRSANVQKGLGGCPRSKRRTSWEVVTPHALQELDGPVRALEKKTEIENSSGETRIQSNEKRVLVVGERSRRRTSGEFSGAATCAKRLLADRLLPELQTFSSSVKATRTRPQTKNGEHSLCPHEGGPQWLRALHSSVLPAGSPLTLSLSLLTSGRFTANFTSLPSYFRQVHRYSFWRASAVFDSLLSSPNLSFLIPAGSPLLFWRESAVLDSVVLLQLDKNLNSILSSRN